MGHWGGGRGGTGLVMIASVVVEYVGLGAGHSTSLSGKVGHWGGYRIGYDSKCRC